MKHVTQRTGIIPASHGGPCPFSGARSPMVKYERIIFLTDF